MIIINITLIVFKTRKPFSPEGYFPTLSRFVDFALPLPLSLSLWSDRQWMRLNWRLLQLISDFPQPTKADTVSHATLSSTGAWQLRVTNLMNVWNSPNTIDPFALVNGLRGGMSRGRMELSQGLFNFLLFVQHESSFGISILFEAVYLIFVWSLTK